MAVAYRGTIIIVLEPEVQILVRNLDPIKHRIIFRKANNYAM